MNTYAAASTEFLALTVTKTVDGVTTPSTDYMVAIVPYGQSSTTITTWATNVPLDGQRGTIVTGLPPGMYAIWTKVTSNPETVIECNGYIRVRP